MNEEEKLEKQPINLNLKLIILWNFLFSLEHYDSKKSTYENRNIFFENTNFSLEEVYNALT